MAIWDASQVYIFRTFTKRQCQEESQSEKGSPDLSDS